ncbi:MAG TPA: hypothetical protein VK817_24920 [Trebonia sp.]|nr:hypothetical protein [Trebonia sp.]
MSLWHGLRDFLPVTRARWLAARVPHITTHFPADEDHTNVVENNRAGLRLAERAALTAGMGA